MARREVVDKQGEKLSTDDRVMVDGALTATVVGVDDVNGKVRVQIDGEEDTVGIRDFRLRPTGWEAPEIESLGDGVNQAMRANAGQPN